MDDPLHKMVDRLVPGIKKASELCLHERFVAIKRAGTDVDKMSNLALSAVIADALADALEHGAKANRKLAETYRKEAADERWARDAAERAFPLSPGEKED